ncbi:uncharacterized protein LOC112517827 [Cynara cardunculus var. scolymus]|uniref:uncharacterized protein LOC112517827 n=1 Tax=Cynara cardunculus var. scolymus TaxID=59895 RepID=UPI000D627B87|nr:uncharacterized protein LOC112517827 [Cynara cardunculus var. scolymus]
MLSSLTHREQVNIVVLMYHLEQMSNLLSSLTVFKNNFMYQTDTYHSLLHDVLISQVLQNPRDFHFNFNLEVSLVINYDLPNNRELYIHRIGRSGHFGRKNCCLMTPLARVVIKYLSNPHGLQIVYSGAVLEVCMRKLLFYPEIVSFIEDEKDKFPSVKVHYAFNAPPKLIMLDGAGQRKEIIRQVLLCIAAMYCYLLTKLAFQGFDVI